MTAVRERVWPGIGLWLNSRLPLAVARLPLVRLTREPGSVVGWENHRDRAATAFVVELPAGSLAPASVSRFARAVLDVAKPARGAG